MKKDIKEWADLRFHGDVLAARKRLRDIYLEDNCTFPWKWVFQLTKSEEK